MTDTRTRSHIVGVLVACLILGAGYLGWRRAVQPVPAREGTLPARGGLLASPGGVATPAQGSAVGGDKPAAGRGEGATASWARTGLADASARPEAGSRAGQGGSQAERAGAASRGGGRLPAVHEVAEGETLFSIARRYGVEVAALQEENGLASDLIRPGQLLILPGGGKAGVLEGTYIWPVLAPISSYFGPRWGRNHNGIDLAASHGDEIRASRGGVVWLAGEVPGYGQTVVIGHADGSRTLYGHASKLLVAAGDRVEQGQAIALVGATGNSTGPHLHFEITVDDRPVNPLRYLPAR